MIQVKYRNCVLEQVFLRHNPKSILFRNAHVKLTKLNKVNLVT